MIGHSHDDLGWLNTMKQYYECTGRLIYTNTCVRDIFNNVFDELLKDERRIFN